MLRRALAVLLLTTVTRAQVESIVKSPFLPEDSQAVIKSDVWVVPEYYRMRVGRSERVMLNVGVESTLAGKTSQNVYWLAVPEERSGSAPTQLSVQGGQGFTITEVRYPRATGTISSTIGQRLRVFEPRTAYFHFVLKADPTVAVGDYQLKGTLKFQPVDSSGIAKPQALEFLIPVKIVESTAEVAKNPYYPSHLAPWQIVGLILLAPILLPIGLIVWNGC